MREGSIWHKTNQADYLVLDGMICEEDGEIILESYIVKDGELIKMGWTNDWGIDSPNLFIYIPESDERTRLPERITESDVWRPWRTTGIRLNREY